MIGWFLVRKKRRRLSVPTGGSLDDGCGSDLCMFTVYLNSSVHWTIFVLKLESVTSCMLFPSVWLIYRLKSVRLGGRWVCCVVAQVMQRGSQTTSHHSVTVKERRSQNYLWTVWITDSNTVWFQLVLSLWVLACLSDTRRHQRWDVGVFMLHWTDWVDMLSGYQTCDVVLMWCAVMVWLRRRCSRNKMQMMWWEVYMTLTFYRWRKNSAD